MHPDVAAEILGTSVAALKVDGGAGDVRGQKRPLSSEPEKPDTPKADAINDELDAIFDEAIKQRRDSQLKFVFFQNSGSQVMIWKQVGQLPYESRTKYVFHMLKIT